MKLSPTLMTLLGACAVFLISPSLPTPLLNLTVGTKVGSLALFLLVLAVARQDTVLGLATFLAVAALFLEHRHRLVSKASLALSATDKPKFAVEQLSKPAPDLVEGEVHPQRETADTDDYGFEPTEESGSNKYDGLPPGESQDDKEPLETVPPHPEEVSSFFQSRGLANIS